MYHAILVPLDGSPWSEYVLPTAVSLAKQTGATVHLVHVYNPAPIMIPEQLLTYDAEDGPQRERFVAYLEKLAQHYRHEQVPMTTALLDGRIAPALQEYARQHAIDLTIMITHSRGDIERLWFGSVADQLLRSLPTPFLLLHPKEVTAKAATPLEIHNMLVPLDGSALSETIIPHALALGKISDATYTLLHVIEQIPTAERHPLYKVALGDELLAAATQATEAYLHQRATATHLPPDRIQTAFELGDPVEKIATYAQQHEIDLIAMATHGRSGFTRWYFGSVANSVLRANTIPLLICLPTQHAEAPQDAHPTRISVTTLM